MSISIEKQPIEQQTITTIYQGDRTVDKGVEIFKASLKQTHKDLESNRNHVTFWKERKISNSLMSTLLLLNGGAFIPILFSKRLIAPWLAITLTICVCVLAILGFKRDSYAQKQYKEFSKLIKISDSAPWTHVKRYCQQTDSTLIEELYEKIWKRIAF